MKMAFECPLCHAEVEAEASDSGASKPCPRCKADVRVPNFTFGPGAIVGGYRLLELIAKGGSGQVFKARQLAMDRIVALKILAPAMPEGQDHLPRFLNEVDLTARLEHANIVTAYGAGVDQGVYFMAMAYVAGESLDRKLERDGPMDEREALLLARQIALALDYAWSEHKILHRDVKPANILLDGEGKPLLTDLGLSKSLAEAKGVTVGASALGTPNYMSPEQVRGEPSIDCRADIYSLGATLYHMLTGSMPFKETGIYETLRKQVQHRLPDARAINPRLSNGSVRLLEIMLAKDRDLRHPDWKALVEDIDRVLAHSIPARRFSRRTRRNVLAGSAALAVIGILVASGLHAVRTQTNTPPTRLAHREDASRGRVPGPSATASNTVVSLQERLDAIRTIHPHLDVAARFNQASQGLTANLAGVANFTDLKLLAGLPIVDLDLTGTNVSDLAPLKGMPLRRLILSETAVSDLAPLAGMWLNEIHLASTPVKDISVLKGMPLRGGITLARTMVSDISPLQDMPLTWINLWETPVTDLAPLRGMPLVAIDLTSTGVSDLQPLKGMRLRELKLYRCRNVSDLSALQGMPLQSLNLEGCDQVRDIGVLGTLAHLTVLQLDARLSELLWSSFAAACGRGVQTAAEFAEQFKDAPALSEQYKTMQDRIATMRRQTLPAGR